MSLVVVFFLAGAVLLAAEVFLPGAIAGIVGAAFLLAGVVYSFIHYGAGPGWFSAAAAVALVGFAVWFEFWLLPRTPWGRKLFLDKAVDGRSHPAPAAGESLIGRTAQVVTPLFPTGNITIDGRSYEAFCQDGSAPSGATVRVIGQDTFRIIVSTKS